MTSTTFVLLVLTVLVVSVTANTITGNSSSFPWQLICSTLANNEPPYNTTTLLTILNRNTKIFHKTQQQLADELYNSVIVGDYEAAVIKSLQLEQDGNSKVIVDTVKKLLNDSKREIVEFAYKLWNMFGKDIVKDYFPLEFRILFNEETFLLVDKKYGLFTVVTSIENNEKDRILYGRRPDERVKFILKPIWEDNRVYFKFEDTTYHRYVRVTNVPEGENFLIYSGYRNSDHSYHWYLHPSTYQGDLLFYVVNRENNRVLKFSDSFDQNGSRLMHGSKSEYANNPLLFGWYIRPM